MCIYVEQSILASIYMYMYVHVQQAFIILCMEPQNQEYISKCCVIVIAATFTVFVGISLKRQLKRFWMSGCHIYARLIQLQLMP